MARDRLHSPEFSRFAREVRDVLAHLYDPVFLQTHPLTHFAVALDGEAASRRNSTQRAGAVLRQHILDAIAALDPGLRQPDVGRGSRVYKLLTLRYVEAQEPADVQGTLGISKSLYYLDHERAVGAVISVLAERWGVDIYPGLPGMSRLVGVAAVPDGASGTLAGVASDRAPAAAPATAPLAAWPLNTESTSGADDAARLPAASPMATPVTTSMPMPVTSFVGREPELAAIHLLLTRNQTRVRLLTLTGPAGTGKTRLALRVVQEAARWGVGQAVTVQLAAIRDPDLVPAALAQALGVQESPTQPLITTISEVLDVRPHLLVLDNFEQVIDAGQHISELIAACPNLVVLVTSREPLRIYGEREFPVEPLPLPPAGSLVPAEQVWRSAAVQLFVERAQAVRPDFSITDQNASAVAEVCCRLDGLPLAIELAAARIRLLTPEAMVSRLHDRLALLTGGARDLPARQRTLREAITWSHELLDSEERILFRRLAVFSGGASLEAIEAVGGGVESPNLPLMDTLETLVAKSLVKRGRDGAEPRFWMLETIQAYALEHLVASGEHNLLPQVHATYFLKLAEEARRELGRRETGWLDRLEAEHGNIRAALAWFHQRGSAPEGLRLASALTDFWLVRSHMAEGREWFRRLLALPSAGKADAVRAQGLLSAGIFARTQHDYVNAQRKLTESVAIATQVGVGAQRIATVALRFLGNLMRELGDYATARVHLEASLSLAEAGGDAVQRAMVLGGLGELARCEGHFGPAATHFEAAVSLLRDQHSATALAIALHNQGHVILQQGDSIRAERLFQESLEIFQERGSKRAEALCRFGLAAVAAVQGRLSEAARLIGIGEALLQLVGLRVDVALEAPDRAALEQTVTALRASLGEATYQQQVALGRERDRTTTAGETDAASESDAPDASDEARPVRAVAGLWVA